MRMKGLSAIALMAITLLNTACSPAEQKPTVTSQKVESFVAIGNLLDSFNVAAARADFDTYFSFFASDAVFTGTDATERWTKEQYMAWAKPYFDKKNTWNFKAMERHFAVSEDANTVWFDELLNTQMKICRGSGVWAKQEDGWKLKQYILSTTVPNNVLDSVISLKAAEEDSIITNLQK